MINARLQSFHPILSNPYEHEINALLQTLTCLLELEHHITSYLFLNKEFTDPQKHKVLQ